MEEKICKMWSKMKMDLLEAVMVKEKLSEKVVVIRIKKY